MVSFRTVLGLMLCAGLPKPALALDLDSMPASEITALERRLADAQCYSGQVDGVRSDDLRRAIAACPTQDPQLRIETGMHVVTVRRIGVDAACTLAATGSDDKTLRVWSLPDGRLLRTIRVPIGPGNDGKIFGVAMSPDGRFIAAGGWDAQSEVTKKYGIYVFEAATGALVAHVGAFDNVIEHMSFSPDGQWLVVSLAVREGVRMIDTSKWIVAADDKPYGDFSYGNAFGPDGRVYTTSYDGKLRSYGPGPEFSKENEVVARGGKRPYSVSVDASGSLVAVGFDDTTRVDVYDAKTLAFRYTLRPAGPNNGDQKLKNMSEIGNGDLSKVAWTTDGRFLVVGGRFQNVVGNQWRYPTIPFGRDGRQAGPPVRVARSTVFDLKPCGDAVAVSSAEPAFGLVGNDGSTRLWKEGVAPDLREKLDVAFTLSEDGKTVRFAPAFRSEKQIVFDVGSGTLTDSPQLPPGLSPPMIDGLPVTNWKNETSPRLGATPITLENYDMSRALAIRADRQGFALGTEYSVSAFDAAGKNRWVQPVPGVAWGVNVSADGRLVAAAYGDGTVRWHRWSDGRELLALFVNKDTKAWVAWTPSGYYTASPGGEDLIGWHLNRGWDQAADFFPASRFRDRFNRPDVVSLVLDTLDEGEALKRANGTARRHDDQRALIERLPPVLTIVSPNEGSREDPGAVEIRYATRSPSGVPVDRVEAFIDGAKVQVRGLARTEPQPAGASPDTAVGAIELPMPAHDATISLVAYAGGLAGDPVKLQLKGTAPAGARGAIDAPDAGAAIASGDAALKPTLYALLIGVTHYDNTKFDLAYPAKDATDLATALQSQKGKLYKDVQIKLLTDKEATATAVKRGLLWLEKQTTARDLAIVFAAGHGTTDAKGKFWFLTSEADLDELSVTAVSREDISDVLFELPGKKLLFLDACHSGAALTGTRGVGGTDVTAAVNDFAQAEGGVVAYAASTGHEFSFERDEWGHGAFTKALIEGLGEGKADLMHRGTITTATLDAYLEDRVKELTGGQQHPVMTRPKTVPDFPIAMDQ